MVAKIHVYGSISEFVMEDVFSLLLSSYYPPSVADIDKLGY